MACPRGGWFGLAVLVQNRLGLLALVGSLVLAVLLGAPPQSVDAVIASNAAPTIIDGFSDGIFGPDTLYSSYSLCCIVQAASYFVRLPTSGIPVGSMTYPAPYDKNPLYRLGGANGFTLTGEMGMYQYTGPSTIQFTLTATDGYSTRSKTITVIFTESNQFFYGYNFILDTQSTDDHQPGVWGSIWSGSTFSTTFTTSYWAATDHFHTTTDAWPLAQHWGRTDATSTLANGEVKKYSLYIIHEMEPIIDVKWTQTLYTNLPLQTTIGTIRAFSDAGVSTITSADASNLFAVSASGYISIRNPLPLGQNQIWNVQVKTGTGTAVTFQIPFSVAQGTTLPSSVISFTPGPLNDWQRGQDVGQARVSGFVPTLWKLYNRNSLVDQYGGQMDLFVIDPKTGFVTSGARAADGVRSMLPGRIHQVTISATDGPNYAEATFDVPVTKSIGRTWHVGFNKSNEYPGVDNSQWADQKGFEHLTDVLFVISAGQGNQLPPWVAGYTIKIYYNEDPNYYADDNGLSQGRYDLRYGLLGPGTFESADPYGPRPRLGGHIGWSATGGDMGGKGFFNIADGDVTLRNLEISWCTGGGSPDGDMTHGISCVRKNADVWGDFTMEGCFVHDNNNGLESGSGPYDVYLRNNVMGNSGTEYVSAGATHVNYLGANSYVEVTGNLYYQTINGHNLKTRALTGLIKGNRIYDGERGGASSQIDICTGGQYVVENNDIHKGPNAQSYSAILFAEEGTTDLGRPHSLLVRNNRIAVVMPEGNHFGDGSAISVARINWHQYPPGDFIIENNQVYLQPLFINNLNMNSPYGDGNGVYPTIIVRNNVYLKEPFELIWTDPGTPNPKAPRLGWIPWSYDGNGGNFQNFGYGMQIDPGKDDMRVWAGAPIGTVVGHCKGGGSAYWNHALDQTKHANSNPFPDGAAWRIVPDMKNFYGTSKINVAPPERFLLDSQTGVITTGTAINMSMPFPTLEFIVVEAKPTSGSLVGTPIWFRFYVATTANPDGTGATPYANMVTFTFNINLDQATAQWQSQVATAVCTSVGIPTRRCRVMSVVAGSVIIGILITPPAAGDADTISVDAVTDSLTNQLTDAQSPLRTLPTFANVEPQRGVTISQVYRCSDGSYTDPCAQPAIGDEGRSSSNSITSNPGALAGIVIGAIVAFGLVIALGVFCMRSRVNQRKTALDRIRTEMREMPGVTMPSTSAAYIAGGMPTGSAVSTLDPPRNSPPAVPPPRPARPTSPPAWAAV